MIPLLLLAAAAATFPAGDALEEAEALLRAGKPAEAMERIEGALEADPPVPPETKGALLLALARCHRALGNLWDAEGAFARALEARPDSFEAARGRGENFLDLASRVAAGPRAGGSDVRALAADAKRWLAAAARLQPEDVRTRRNLARARILDLDFEGAAADLRALAAGEAGKDADVHHFLAAALRGAGDRAAAAAAEAACLERDPRRSDAAALRVGDLAAAGKPAEARDAAVEALVRDPSADAVCQALWKADAGEGRFLALEEALLRVLAKHPDHPRLLHYLGYARLSGGRRDAALEAFQRKAALEPGSPAALLPVGRLLVAKGDLAGAEKAFEEALAALPEEDEGRATAMAGLDSIGKAHGDARRFAEAERIFRRLAALDPGAASFRTLLGLSLRRLGRNEEAEAAYRESADLAPFDANPWNELGMHYLGWGKAAEAREAFLRATETDPRFTWSLETLGNLDRAAGRMDEARARFLEAYRRAASFRDEDDRLKYRRMLDLCAHSGR